METITDIPLYDLIQEIEKKHGTDIHMCIEAFIDDDNLHDDLESEVPVDKLMWWCEFQDQTKVFDRIESVKHWFLNEVVVDPQQKLVVESE